MPLFSSEFEMQTFVLKAGSSFLICKQLCTRHASYFDQQLQTREILICTSIKHGRKHCFHCIALHCMQHNLHCYCRQRHRAELVRTHADTSPPTIQAQTQPTHHLIFRRSLNSFAGAAASPPPAGPPAAAHAPAGAPAVAHAPVAAPAVAASATNATQHIVSSADRDR